MHAETEKLNRRTFLRTGAVGLMSLAAGAVGGYLAGQSGPAPSTTTSSLTTVGGKPLFSEKITFASAADTVFFQSIPRLLTIDNLKMMGYNAELLASPQAVAAFLAKEAQILLLSPSSIMPAIEQNEDIALIGPDTSPGFQLVSSSSISSLQDLQGRAVGISRPGALDDMLPRYLLKQAGVDSGKVNWIAIGGESLRVPALMSGRIDAGLLNVELSLRTIGQSSGKLHVLTDVSNARPGLVPDIIQMFAYRNWAVQNPQVIRDILRARILAEVWGVNNVDSFLSFAASRILNDTSSQSLQSVRKVYDIYRSKGWLPYLSIDLESIKLQLELAKEAGVIKGVIPLEQIYEPKYLAEAIQQIQQLQG